MRIGILTHYYNSTNYGGSLQAYALCKALEQMGHEAQQVCIDHSLGCYNLLDTSRLAPIKRMVGKPVKKWIKTSVRWLSPGKNKAYRMKQQRHNTLLKAFSSFNQGMTPHSTQVYTTKNIAQAAARYDAFITGSDQVWNPIWYFSPFFLDFVPSDKIKIAYAASIGQKTLPTYVEAVFRKHLKSFHGISVREQDAVDLLAPLTEQPVTCVLDPTLLLSRADWEQVCAPCQIDKPYALCYFLGDETGMRSTAQAYAKDHGLTLVNIADAAGLIHMHDRNFSDVAVKDPSVEVFLSLIRHAQYVFTDSFHASVFSLLFQRQFVVFPRSTHKAMGSRLTNLTSLFDIPERFCCCPEEEHLSYIHGLTDIDYTAMPPAFLEKKQQSLDFLEAHLRQSGR